MIKTNGAELKAFLRDDWSKWSSGNYYEDDEIEINGNLIDGRSDELDLKDVENSAQVKILSGTVYDEDCNEICSLETQFKRWKKRQTHETLVIEIPKDRVDALKNFVKQERGKVF